MSLKVTKAGKKRIHLKKNNSTWQIKWLEASRELLKLCERMAAFTYSCSLASEDNSLYSEWRIIWNGTVWYGMVYIVWCGVVWCGMALYSVVWYCVVWYSTLMCGVSSKKKVKCKHTNICSMKTVPPPPLKILAAEVICSPSRSGTVAAAPLCPSLNTSLSATPPNSSIHLYHCGSSTGGLAANLWLPHNLPSQLAEHSPFEPRGGLKTANKNEI